MISSLGTYKTHALINAPKIDTDFLWDLTFLFVGLALLYLGSVFFFRNRITSTSKKVRQRKGELSPMISEFLFFEEDAPKTEKTSYVNLKIQIRQLLKDDFNRRVLSEILLDLRKDVSGDTQRRLFKLYTDLGLQNDAFKKLKSWRWEVVSKGILELTQMRVQESYGFIKKFINDKRSTIRKQAEIATVALKHEGINYFLDTTKYKISEWQQLKLLDVIRNQEDFKPPLFKVWLTSRNKHVVLFALRLIKYYRQSDARASLIALVKHKNDQIKEEAIQCVKEFNIVEAINTLQVVFWKCNTDIKISILDAIAYIGDSSHIEFLQSIENKERNFSVKSKAIAAINTISPESVMPTQDIQDISNYTIPENIEPETKPVISNTQNDSLEDEINGEVECREIIERRHEPHISEIQSNDIEIKDASYNDLEERATIEPLENAENIVEGEERPLTETHLKNSNTGADKENEVQTALNIDFVPLLIDNQNNETMEKESTSEKYQLGTVKENLADDIKSLEVVFEELGIGKTNFEIERTAEDLDMEVTELDFLPIVVENEFKERDRYAYEIGADKDQEVFCDLQDMKVVFEEVFDILIKKEADEIDVLKNELDLLPLVTDKKDSEQDQINNVEAIEMPKSVDISSCTYINDINVISEIICGSMIHDKDSDELGENCSGTTKSDSHIKQEQPEKDVVTWLLEDNDIRELELHYEEIQVHDSELLDLIPKPRYYDAHEAYIMNLLDDIEELGDQREISLLKEFLAEENVTFVRERIEYLIEYFSIDIDEELHIAEQDKKMSDMPVFSVFEDLFRLCDTEKKLILLDEVVAVGDEKDIAFLDKLVEDPDFRIREKARLVYKGLMKKLAKEEEMKNECTDSEDKSPLEIKDTVQFNFQGISQKANDTLLQKDTENAVNGLDDIFNIPFELSDSDEIETSDIKNLEMHTEKFDSFFDQIFSIPKKIIGKLNG